MNFKYKTRTHLVSYEEAPYKRFFNRLNKWPSMPILQIPNKQGVVSGAKDDIKRPQIYSSSSMSLSSSTYNLFDTSKSGSETKSNIENCDSNELDHLFNSNYDEFDSEKQIADSQRVKSENIQSSSISLQTLELTIDTCKIFESKEPVCEQLFDISLLSFDESDASSLVNVLNTLKFNNESDSNNMKSQQEGRKLKYRSENTVYPLKNNENLFYVRKDGANRNLKDSFLKDVLRQQDNRSEEVESIYSVNDSLSKEYLMHFKDRLKEIRKENMTIPVTNKPIHNGNRFSRVFNYCFLMR